MLCFQHFEPSLGEIQPGHCILMVHYGHFMSNVDNTSMAFVQRWKQVHKKRGWLLLLYRFWLVRFESMRTFAANFFSRASILSLHLSCYAKWFFNSGSHENGNQIWNDRRQLFFLLLLGLSIISFIAWVKAMLGFEWESEKCFGCAAMSRKDKFLKRHFT